MHKIQSFFIRIFLLLFLFLSLINISFAQQEWWSHELPKGNEWKAVDRIGNGIISQVCYSPDYDGQVYLAVVTSIGVELHSDGNRRLFFPSTAPIKAFAFHPTEKLLATVDKNDSGEYVVKLWKIDDPQKCLSSEYSLNQNELEDASLDFSDDGKWLAVGYSKIIIVWEFDKNAPDLESLGYLKEPPALPISSICFGTMPDGKIYLTAGMYQDNESKVEVWSLSESTFIKEGEIETSATGEIAVVSHFSGYLAIGSENGIQLKEMFAEDVEEGKISTPKKDWTVPNPPVYQVVFHPVGNILGAVTKDGAIIYQEIDKEVESPPLELDGQLSLSFHPDGVLLAVVEDEYSVKIWDWQKETSSDEKTGYTEPFKTFDVDKSAVATVTETEEPEKNGIMVWRDGVGRWQLDTKPVYDPPEVSEIYSLSLSTEQDLVAIGYEKSADNIIADIRSLNVLNKIREFDYNDAVKSGAVSSDENWLIIGLDRENPGHIIKSDWDQNSFKTCFTDVNEDVTSIDFAPNNDLTFAVGVRDNDGNGKLWLHENDDQLRSVKTFDFPVVDIAFVSENEVAVAMVKEVSGENGENSIECKVEIVNIDGNIKSNISSDEFEKVITSIDYGGGKLFVATGNDIEVWEYRNSKLTKSYTLEGHTDIVTEVIWDDQKENLLSSSKDGTILFWELEITTTQSLTVKIVKPEENKYVPTQFEVELEFNQEILLDSIGNILQINGTETEATNVRLGEKPGSAILEFDLKAEEFEDNVITVMIDPDKKEVNTVYGLADDITLGLPNEITLNIGVNVWPGDTNNDKSVDVLDILPIGLFYENSGEPRQDASYEWKLQGVKPWNPNNNDYDRALADANGDGTVNEKDVEPIAKNWGRSVAAQSPILHTDPPLAEFGLKPEMLEIYRRMYSVLDSLDGTEGSIVLKKVIGKIIAKLQKQVPSETLALLPQKTKLLQNFPNPFNPETWIPYQLAAPAEVSIEIYDLSGHLIRTLQLGHKPAGFYVEKSKAGYWDGRNRFGERVASGLYFYKFRAGRFSAQKRLVIVK